MAATLTFVTDFKRKFYSAYRPIPCTVTDVVGDVAYLRGELQRGVTMGGVFQGFDDTGIIVDSYMDIQNSNQYLRYTFNIMGFVREFISHSNWSEIQVGGHTGWDELGDEWRLNIWAVRYPATQGLGLIHDTVDNIFTRSFYAVAATTNVRQHYSNQSLAIGLDLQHNAIDALVLGQNLDSDISLNTNTYSLLFSQNKWNPKTEDCLTIGELSNWRSSKATGAYTVNMDDVQTDCIYSLVRTTPTSLLNNTIKGYNRSYCAVAIVSLDGTSIVDTLILQLDGDKALNKIPAHPVALWNFCNQHGITTTRCNEICTISSAAGIVTTTLTCGGAIIYQMVVAGTHPVGNVNAIKYQEAPIANYKNLFEASTVNFTNNPYINGPPGIGSYLTPTYLDFSNEPGNGKVGTCNRREDGAIESLSKFAFKTGAGGYDWINIFGKESKETSFESVLFDKSADHSYDHTRTVLHNSREDVFKLVSQPVNSGIARHIEEMITSSKVWIQREDLYPRSWPQYASYSATKYYPIIIVPGSFEIYNTEENLNYIEFSYTPSEQITIQGN